MKTGGSLNDLLLICNSSLFPLSASTSRIEAVKIKRQFYELISENKKQ